MKTLIVAAMFLTTGAFAGVQGYNASEVNLGNFSKLFCSTGLTCTRDGNRMKMIATQTNPSTLASDEVLSNVVDDVVDIASNDSDMVFSITSPLASNGDSTLRLIADASADSGDEWQLLNDGATNDLLFQNDKSGTHATFFTLTEDGDAALAGTTPHLTIGDAGAEDAGILFDGHSGGVDFHIANDDSVDLLAIGVGLVAGTTDAIRVDGNADVTFVQNVLGLGTDSLSGFLQKQVAATATTITAAQCGSTFINSGAIEMELPEASTVLGCRLTFIVGNASAFTIDPDGADQIMLLTNAAGDSLIADAVGESMVIEAISASAWAQVGAVAGTWTDSN